MGLIVIDFGDRVNQLADLSIARGVGFGALAIMCGMVGMGSLAIAFKFGGFSFLFTTMVLLIRDRVYLPEQFKRTEVWIMLRPEERPPPEIASRLIMTARHQAMMLWGFRASAAAALFLAFALLMDIFG